MSDGRRSRINKIIDEYEREIKTLTRMVTKGFSATDLHNLADRIAQADAEEREPELQGYQRPGALPGEF